jgi:hypothetical protein
MRRRALLAASLILVTWAALVYMTGGVSGTILGIKLSSRDAVRPLVLAVVLLGVVLRLHGWRAVDADVEWLFGRLSRMTVPIVAAASVATLWLGVAYGTLIAGGSDSYGYVSEADLWLNHQVRVAQPFVGELPIPYADRAFTPLAYRPVGSDHVIVPTYPAGLPLLMAAAKLIAGPRAVYAVVPILGALTIGLCYLLGARAASPVVGAVAAIGLATSPVFLFILMAPMSDIPATAFWTAAIVLTLGSRKYSALVAGICCAVAIVIRPNLAPLALVPAAYLVWTRGGWRSFAIGVLPGVLVVAAVNARLYGSPFVSGYGDLGSLYTWRNAPVNLRRYGGWLLDTQTPLVFLAIVALVKRPRGAHVLLALFVAGVWASYLFYAPFDAWWYLRFLLPAWPMLLILMSSGAIWILTKTPRLLQAIVLAAIPALVVSYQIEYAVSHGVFAQRESERRYAVVGDYVAASTPANAVVLSMQHSGSLRYYGHRITLRYDWIEPGSLDSTLALLRERGYRPFIVLDDWEETSFKQRFAESAIGRLELRPLAEFDDAVAVRVYEPPPAR